VTVGVVEVDVVDTHLAAATLSGRSAPVCTVGLHRGWLGVVTGISEASTGGVLVSNEYPQNIARYCVERWTY